ncbi:hypothetical protein PMAYCL1PPCAC_32296, partial [Pristionchus mayeri]
LQKVHKDPTYTRSGYNWIMYYVHRWLRLTPAYVFFIFFVIAWIPRMNGGLARARPQLMKRIVQKCEDNWWMNALYINNFKTSNEMCYGISWFLSVDMQLYWTAPIFLLALHYSWKSGLGAAVVGVISSTATIVFLTAHFDLPAMSYNTYMPHGNLDQLRLNYSNYIYNMPWTRCIPYLIGILCGYLIILVKKKNVEIRRPKKWHLVGGWLLATLSALIVVFGVYNYIRGAATWGVGLRSAYAAFSRIGSSAAVAWVVLACAFDWAGPVKTLLEHPLWQPLGRLSYCAYLVHFFVLLV